jgi:protein SCO1/2
MLNVLSCKLDPTSASPGDKSPCYGTAPDKSGFTGFIQRCIVARKFITGRFLPVRTLFPGQALRTRTPISKRSLVAAIYLLAILLTPPTTTALADHPAPGSVSVETVDYEQKLNAQVPLDLTFRDEAGQSVRLAHYFGSRPVVLLFAYYECPMLCTLVLNNLTKSLKALAFTPGEQFEIITVSMDPNEIPELAAAKKATYMQDYNRPGAERGWHFLTGSHAEIDRLADTVGFRYEYDAQIDQYAHPAGVILLTPGGRVSRYLPGIDYTPRDLRLGLVEAAEQKIGTPVDQFFLLCYQYDPHSGRYTPVIKNIIRLAGSATVAALGGMVLWLLKRERSSSRAKEIPDHPHGRPQHG